MTLLNQRRLVSRFEVVTHDRDEAAEQAARSVCYHAFITNRARQLSFAECTMIHRQFKHNNLEMIQTLAYRISSYSNQFTERYDSQQGCVVIMGADDGCVNNGVVLATAWLDSDGSFYWED